MSGNSGAAAHEGASNIDNPAKQEASGTAKDVVGREDKGMAGADKLSGLKSAVDKVMPGDSGEINDKTGLNMDTK